MGTDHSLVLVHSLGFHWMSMHVAVKGAERTIPSWEHLQAQRLNHKSFEESKTPIINSSWPWIQPRAHCWMIHWWAFFGHSKDERRCCSQSRLGPMLITPFYFIFKKPWARQSPFALISTQPSQNRSKGNIKHVIARGFLNLPGPRMGLFPANPPAFPGFGVVVVTGFWMSCHHSHSNAEVPFSLKPCSATGRGGR